MRKFVIKFLSKNPFDNSECNQNVQVLCDIETGEFFGILDSQLNLDGQIISAYQMESEWISKKSKHIVVGDSVVFGHFHKYNGIVADIIEYEDDYSLDMCLVRNVSCNLDEVLTPAQLNEVEVEEDRLVLRKDLQVKPWVVARII